MPNAYFAAVDEDESGGRYESDESTTGPWNAGLQHGGPPSALLVRAAERAAQATGRDDLVALRYAGDFLRAVPVATVTVATEVVRAARRAVLVAATLQSEDRTCLQARVWLVSDTDTVAVAHAPTACPMPDEGRGLGSSFPYGDSIEWRAERGGLTQPGPGTMWARPRQPLVAADGDTDELSGLQHAVLVGDSASGISAELDWASWSFLNIDLDVHLARPVFGSWVRIDAQTQLGAHGSALARSTLSDERGPLGTTAQTLVLSPRLPTL